MREFYSIEVAAVNFAAGSSGTGRTVQAAISMWLVHVAYIAA
jgi:hypothetical protein